MESVFLPDAPQASYLADGTYHIISRDPNIQMKNDSGAARFPISTLSCQAFVVRPSCKSKLSFNQGDLKLVPDMDFCKNNPETLLVTIELTPSFDQSFRQVPNATQKPHTYFIAEARQSVPNTVRLEIAELPNVKSKSPETFRSNSSYCQVLLVHFIVHIDSSFLMSPHSNGRLFYGLCHVVSTHLPV